MKIKYLTAIPLLMLFLLPSASLAQTAGSSYQFNQNLTVGSNGPDVIALQQLLINKGFLTSVSAPTGYFGNGTQTALGKFQAANGIFPASGYCGSKTRVFLNSLSMSPVQSMSVADSQENQNSIPTNPTPPLSPSNANVCAGTLCNGTCYNSCPTGDDFICPASGKAYCQPGQQQRLASLEAALQSWQNELVSPNKQIASIQNQLSQQQCDIARPINYMSVQAGNEQARQLGECNGLVAEEEAEVQSEAPALNQIAIIQQEIQNIENTQ